MKQKNPANFVEVTETIWGSYLLHAGEHTKVFMNKIEKLGLYIPTSSVIIQGKLQLPVSYKLRYIID